MNNVTDNFAPDDGFVLLEAERELRAAKALVSAGLTLQSLEHYSRAADMLARYMTLKPEEREKLSPEDAASAEIVQLVLATHPETADAIAQIAAVKNYEQLRANRRERMLLESLITRSTEIYRRRYRPRERGTWVRLTREIMAVLIAVAVILLGAHWSERITEHYNAISPIRADGPQGHYQSFAAQAGDVIKYLVDLGRNGALISDRVTAEGYTIRLDGFHLGPPWNREVSWHVEGHNDAKISVFFPANSASGIALFLTDGDGYFRMSEVRTSGRSHIADQLHDGRWLSFEVTDEERQQGQKDFVFRQLTGPNISISGIAVTDAETPVLLDQPAVVEEEFDLNAEFTDLQPASGQ